MAVVLPIALVLTGCTSNSASDIEITPTEQSTKSTTKVLTSAEIEDVFLKVALAKTNAEKRAIYSQYGLTRETFLSRVRSHFGPTAPLNWDLEEELWRTDKENAPRFFAKFGLFIQLREGLPAPERGLAGELYEIDDGKTGNAVLEPGSLVVVRYYAAFEGDSDEIAAASDSLSGNSEVETKASPSPSQEASAAPESPVDQSATKVAPELKAGLTQQVAVAFSPAEDRIFIRVVGYKGARLSALVGGGWKSVTKVESGDATYDWPITSTPYRIYLDGVMVATWVPDEDSTETPTSTATAPGYNYQPLNVQVVAPDGMGVTVTELFLTSKSGSTQLTVAYWMTNNTSDKEIVEGSFALFYDDGSKLNQYGVFNNLFPGDSSNRRYVFEWTGSKKALLIEYGADFFATKPTQAGLKWKAPE